MRDTLLKDKNGRHILNGDMVQGFGCIFEVKFGIAEVEKVSPYDPEETNLVQIPCFYFEDIETKEKVFPIKKNYLGKNDLEDLEVIAEEGN